MPAENTELDYFNFTVEEKIGLKDYSNIVVRASISRYVPDDEEARAEVIRLVEDILVAERQVILDDLGVNRETRQPSYSAYS
jgi:hypothetical protein